MRGKEEEGDLEGQRWLFVHSSVNVWVGRDALSYDVIEYPCGVGTHHCM